MCARDVSILTGDYFILHHLCRMSCEGRSGPDGVRLRGVSEGGESSSGAELEDTVANTPVVAVTTAVPVIDSIALG